MAEKAARVRLYPFRIRHALRAHAIPLAVVLCVVVFLLNFANFSVGGDGLEYFSFVQRLFGDRSSATATGYNFGVGLMNAPFYGLARLITVAAPHSGLAFRSLTQASIAFASIFWIAVTMTITFWLLGQLRLEHRGLVVAAAVLGTPVWFYGSFEPSYSHAADSAAFSFVAAALYRTLKRPGPRRLVVAGGAFALAIAVRPANAGALLGVCIALCVYRRFHDAAWIAASAVALWGALVAIPLGLGTSLVEWHGGNIYTETTGFSPLSPVWMLFTVHRGLFLWTPVTALAVVGAVIGIRQNRERLFLVTLSAGCLGLLATYANVSSAKWDGAGSYSNRFLTSPVVFYAIGLGCLLASARGRLTRIALIMATVACTGLALFVGLNEAEGASLRVSLNNIFGTYFDGQRSGSQFASFTWQRSHLRKIVDHL